MTTAAVPLKLYRNFATASYAEVREMIEVLDAGGLVLGIAERARRRPGSSRFGPDEIEWVPGGSLIANDPAALEEILLEIFGERAVELPLPKACPSWAHATPYLYVDLAGEHLVTAEAWIARRARRGA